MPSINIRLKGAFDATLKGFSETLLERQIMGRPIFTDVAGLLGIVGGLI